jgi:hypothetical protein
MSTIKTQYQEIFALLEENSNKKVSTILPQLVELMSRKCNNSGQVNTFHKDEEGNVIAIYCYYHKKWELVNVAEYGAKATSATKLNTMCKEGVSNWTKQQRAKKTADTALLTKVASGDIAVSSIGELRDEILEKSKVIVDRTDQHGFETLEEALDSL